jgi:hypothetical protein
MSEPVIHVGLGDHEVVRQLVITWPSGTVDTHHDVPAGRRYRATEGGAITPDDRHRRSGESP